MKLIWMNNIPIELEKKRIKNMYLRILPPDGRVHISAPLRMSEEEITHFISRKLSWIILQQDKLRRSPVSKELQYITGEQLSVWGRSYTLRLNNDSLRNYIEVAGHELLLDTKPNRMREHREKLLREWYKKEMEERIPSLLTKWEARIGVSSNSYRIRDMKTRWGSCNIRTKQICLNLQLAKMSPECLEYVIVHELVHLLEKSHNQVFKSYMDLFLPDWRSIKRKLNQMEVAE